MGGPARIESLTGLRALAALAVVLFHLQVVPFMPEGYARLPGLPSFYLGVDLFFLLSGFVLMHVHGQEFGRPRAATILHFLGLRLARIYPVHLTILAVLGLLVLAQLLLAPASTQTPEWQARFALDGLLRHLALAAWSSPTWNPPAWSLSAEWAAYLAFPALAFLCVRLTAAASAAAIALLLLGFGFVYAGAFDYVLDRHGLVRIGFEFSIGCLLYRLARHCPPGAALAAMALSAIAAAAAFGTRWGDFAVLPLLGATLLACATPTPLARLLSAPWLVWLGEISYALYMVHVLVLALFARAAARLLAVLPGIGWPVLMAASLAAVVLLAAAIHYTIERPFRARARRWLRRGPRSPRTAALAGI
jgi:peptidoglycan/LPS O-acetylase OafA/YrhL